MTIDVSITLCQAYNLIYFMIKITHSLLISYILTDISAEELRRMIEESDIEDEDDSYVASDDENYIPQTDVCTAEESDIKEEMVIEQEEEYDSDESVEDGPVSQNANNIWIAKDETEWRREPLPSAQTRSHNILRGRGGPTAIISLFTPKELFKSIMSPEMCDIILRQTNRKGKRVFVMLLTMIW